MALPVLDATFASAADLPRRMMLARWLADESGVGSLDNYYSLPEKQLWARIGAEVGDKTEADYLGLPTRYIWRDIYNGVAGSGGTIDWSEKEALGHIAAAYRGDTGNPAALATYINWPWRYQVASIIEAVKPDADTLAFITASGATDIKAIDGFVKGVKALGLWDSMVAWPLRSSQNAGTGTTAYSLGGLGTFNGTLVNGPTWGVDGITFDGNNDHITTGITYSYNAANTLFAAVLRTENKTVPRIFGTPEAANSPLFYRNATTQALGSFNGTSYSLMTTPANNTWNTISLAYNASAINAALNSSTATTPYTFATVTQPLSIAAGQVEGSNYWIGPIAIAAYFTADIGLTNQVALAALYKTTLGIGLSLP